MPRSPKAPQTGSIVWYYANPAPAAPQAAIVTQTVDWSSATESGHFNLYVLSGAAVASAVLNVPFTLNAGSIFQTATAASDVAGGANYNIGDTITLSNGVVLTVLTVSTGAVATVAVTKGGSSQTAAPPANPMAQVSTSGTGTGATFNVTWSSGAWCTNMRVNESTATALPGSFMAMSMDIGAGNGNGGNDEGIAPMGMMAMRAAAPAEEEADVEEEPPRGRRTPTSPRHR